MLIGRKPFASAFMALVTLSIAVSASLVPLEQHLLARDDTTGQPGTEAKGFGKLAEPVNLAITGASPQAVMKLVGDDVHAHVPGREATVMDSKLKFPDEGGERATVAPLADAENKAHCYLGHATANIRRIRYKMSIKIDSDESGDTTVAGSDKTRGVVVKATAGLYSSSNPDKGSCAKALARHGEECVNRPYIVPKSLLPRISNSADTPSTGADADPERQQKYHAGPLLEKRPAQKEEMGDSQPRLVLKRDTDKPFLQPDPGMNVMASGSGFETKASDGNVCIDTVKRDKEVIRVVPTAAKKSTKAGSTTDLNFELVRTDDKKGIWRQIIYDEYGNPIDITHIVISSQLSFWRSEYYCAKCKPGHRKHTVWYEDVEIEMDELDEHAAPEVQCEGPAHSTNVHRKKSRYQEKNKSGIPYHGFVFSIDRVVLGHFDKNGKGGIGLSVDSRAHPIYGEIPADTTQKQPTPSFEDSKKLADPVTKRDVADLGNALIF